MLRLALLFALPALLAAEDVIAGEQAPAPVEAGRGVFGRGLDQRPGEASREDISHTPRNSPQYALSASEGVRFHDN